jgi:pyruvate formate lyase activating enzyme
MKIAGFVPLSLCDYPGRVASVIFTLGCSFRCPWCHNGHLLDPNGKTALLDEADILSKLGERKTRVNGIVVTGGEPTVQPDLEEFLRKLKGMGMLVKLDTNGTRPDLLKKFYAEKLVDYVAMDIKAPWAKYAELTGCPGCPVDKLQESVRLIYGSGVEYQFRTTRVDPMLTAADYDEIVRQLPPGCRHVWQHFRPEYSLDPKLRPEAAEGAKK